MTASARERPVPRTSITGMASIALIGQTRLPHYSHTAALVGTLILLAVFVTLVIAIFRSRRK
ncbi:hypothetical protein [Microtetraspora glauca]|uniref:LPXTG cell wall anchor domain-containing protein n=1 Tax=Microtetraspora glauca TaxID=1996 RepID=A0ABV3GMS1_MICGL